MSKQVTIHLSRRVTLNRAGHDAVELQAGRNTVDADVAAHPFVKAHTVDAGPDHGAELDTLRAEMADMDAKQRARIAELTKSENNLFAIVADLEEQLAQKTADLNAMKEARNEAVAQLAQKTADLEALAASMAPPAADPKSAKGKA